VLPGAIRQFWNDRLFTLILIRWLLRNASTTCVLLVRQRGINGNVSDLFTERIRIVETFRSYPSVMRWCLKHAILPKTMCCASFAPSRIRGIDWHPGQIEIGVVLIMESRASTSRCVESIGWTCLCPIGYARHSHGRRPDREPRWPGRVCRNLRPNRNSRPSHSGSCCTNGPSTCICKRRTRKARFGNNLRLLPYPKTRAVLAQPGTGADLARPTHKTSSKLLDALWSAR
jgi:hypothetical protein